MAAVRQYRNGAWRANTAIYARQAGAWRQLRSLKVFSGGAWRQVANFVDPLTLSVSPANVFGAGNGAYTQSVSSGFATATPAGGKAPYSYAWAMTDGDTSITVNSATNATVTFSKTLAKFDVAYGTARCTVTDANGSTASANVTVTLTNGAI
jgi:hypothetical protein